jgi:lysophospholipid acyltransferase (LPLAT)-like uncharacterized protein
MTSSVTRRVVLTVVPPLAAGLIRLVGSTLRYQDVLAPGVAPGYTIPGPTVFVLWHRSLLVCAHRFRGHGIAVLISQSFDGELIARTVERLGFRAVRGSSSRGGAGGLRAMADAYREGYICAFTADGPRGPAFIAKPGAAQLCELVEAAWTGAFYALPERAWELRSWDRFLIPKPFSRVRMTWPAHVAPSPEAIQAALDESVRMAQAGAEPRRGER